MKCSEWLGVPTDKILHFVCAMALMVAASLLTNPMVGYGVTMAICIGKEIYDMYKPNPTGFTLGDLVADIFGVLVGALIVMI